MIISITGKSGSGKSLIARKLSNKLGFTYVDIDKIGHSIYQDEQMCQSLINLLGNEIVGNDGNIDRKRVSKIIFSNPKSQLREQFNVLTWKTMKEKIDEQIKENKNVVLDWVNLPLVEYWDNSDVKIFVYTNQYKRFEVLKNRDKLTDEQIKLREQASPNYAYCNPDYVYYNRYHIEQTMNFVNSLTAKLSKKCDDEKAM